VVCSYHHWDGYPEGVGATLYHIAHGVFGGDIEQMTHVLVDEHKGWSTINGADWSKPIGFGSPGPQCYCHGERSEQLDNFSLKDGPGSGCEWAYVIFPDGKMLVLSSYSQDGTKMIGMFGMGDEAAEWKLAAEVQLNGGPEPDWSAIQSAAYE
jgi:hypothetical protein